MKILINRKTVEGPWGGGNNFVKAFFSEIPKLGHKVITSLERDIDIIFIMDPRYDNGCISINEAIEYKNYFPNTKIIQRINECDARKGTDNIDNLLLDCSKHIDKTVFVSEWMKQYHSSKGWHCNDNHVVINGVEDFYKKRKKINNGKTNIVTHHWSDNYMKGFDYYEMIDELCNKRDDITFTYIGRERGTFKNTIVIPPLFGEELAKQLGRYDIYISASRFDPGPNHILESIACEIPTFSYFEGGGACEFTGKDFVFNSFEDFVEKLDKKEYNLNNMKVETWEKCMKRINEIF